MWTYYSMYTVGPKQILKPTVTCAHTMCRVSVSIFKKIEKKPMNPIEDACFGRILRVNRSFVFVH